MSERSRVGEEPPGLVPGYLGVVKPGTDPVRARRLEHVYVMANNWSTTVGPMYDALLTHFSDHESTIADFILYGARADMHKEPCTHCGHHVNVSVRQFINYPKGHCG